MNSNGNVCPAINSHNIPNLSVTTVFRYLESKQHNPLIPAKGKQMATVIFPSFSAGGSC